jgi:hypothetical protein
MGWRFASSVIAGAVSGASAIVTAGAAADASPFPPRLASYLTSIVHLTANEQQALRAGRPVSRLLEADPAMEVAVFGAVWVAAPPELYVRAITDIEQFERGANFRFTKKLGNPPTLEDFSHFDIADDEVAALRHCKVGECSIKLSQQALDRIAREVDWSRPTARADAERLVQRIAFEYVNAYREGGNAMLAVYRDNKRPTFVAREFESLVARLPELSTYLPELRRYLLEYPRHTLARSSDYFYFQEAVFGLKPTVRINHVVIAENDEGIAVASKQLYASHYFWTALELRVLVADPSRGRGFWFVNVNLSRSDGLSGFVGRLIRGKVRGEARSAMHTVLRNTKAKLEAEAGRSGA